MSRLKQSAQTHPPALFCPSQWACAHLHWWE